MQTKVITFSLLAVFSIFALFMIISSTFNFTGNIILQPKNSIGDNITGELSFAINRGDIPSKNIPILVSLTKNNKPIKTETLALEKFIQLSDSKTHTENTFAADIEDIIQFTFNESGEYELLFSILELDINKKKVFMVE